MESTKTVQILSELISIAYTVEVGVINSGRISIAGTGIYRKNMGKPVPRTSLAAKCLGTPESLLVRNAGEGRYCKQCIQQPLCPYNAALLCPIYTGPSINGILMLLTANEAQRQVMLKNLPKLRKDIVCMADLFSKCFFKESDIEGAEIFFSMITESQDDGIIMVSDSNRITHLNEAARHLLSCNEQEILGKNLDDAIVQRGFVKHDLSQSYASNRSNSIVSLEKPRGKRSLSYVAKPVKVDDKLAGYILRLEKERPIKKYSRPLKIEQHDFFSGIIGESYEIRKVINESKIISTTDATILLLGETGTGKDVLANAIHKASLRSTGPFVALNCSLMNENLIESELFGYEEGAFTGARKGGKKGKIELAHNGTLFLDEIGELPLTLQAKYLRVIEDGIVEKIGSTNPLLKVNVRIIAATNNDLKQMVSNGTFRKDLYYRINTYTIKLPPLRERVEDIRILTDYFISKQSEKKGIIAKRLDQAVYNYFTSYPWPGNIRELKHAIEYMFHITEGDRITIHDLPLDMQQYMPDYIHKSISPHPSMYLSNFEKDAIRRAVAAFGHTTEGKKKSAKYLGISLTTLYRRLKVLNHHN